MASIFYTQRYADNTSQLLKRAAKQGAPVKPDEFKNSCTVTIHMTEQAYDQYVEAQMKSGMKMSAFGRLALYVGVSNLFESN